MLDTVASGLLGARRSCQDPQKTRVKPLRGASRRGQGNLDGPLGSKHTMASRLAGERKRFMSPGGGPIEGNGSSSSLPGPSATTSTSGGGPGAAGGFAESHFYASAASTGSHMSTGHSLASGRVPSGRGGAASAPPSRFLVTVLPPAYLPHDPPHPRTSTLCSGYGPPSKFR